MATGIRRRLGAMLALAAALTLSTVATPRAHADPTLFTSPIDMTGAKLQVQAFAPDKDSGAMVLVPIPPGVVGPDLQQLMATSLSSQFDAFWTKAGPAGGKSPQGKACDVITGQISDKISKQGNSAYKFDCKLAGNGQLLAQQSGAQVTLAYQLNNNVVRFSSTSPVTCNPDHHELFCPDDPEFSLTFALQIITVMHTPDFCHLAADPGTSAFQGAFIDSQNGAADAYKNIYDPLFKGNSLHDAEQAMDATTSPISTPLDGMLKSLSSVCTGNPLLSPVIQRFSDLAIDLDPAKGFIFRLSHQAIASPLVSFADGRFGPGSFLHPDLSTSLPTVTPGNTVRLDGRYFPFNLGDAAHIDVQSGVGLCYGGRIEIQWGKVGGQMKTDQLSAGASAECPTGYDASGLDLSTAYQFRARACDAVTCSPWSHPITITTGSTNSGGVVLSLDGTQIGTATTTAQGTFSATITVPSGTTTGSHKFQAVNGDAKAETSIQVTAAAPAGTATLKVQAPNGQLYDPVTDDPFDLYGSGFAPGTVSIYLDSATGKLLGTATAGADGTFYQQFTIAKGDLQPHPHTLVAVQNGATQAQLPVTIHLPEVIH